MSILAVEESLLIRQFENISIALERFGETLKVFSFRDSLIILGAFLLYAYLLLSCIRSAISCLMNIFSHKNKKFLSSTDHEIISDILLGNLAFEDLDLYFGLRRATELRRLFLQKMAKISLNLLPDNLSLKSGADPMKEHPTALFIGYVYEPVYFIGMLNMNYSELPIVLPQSFLPLRPSLLHLLKLISKSGTVNTNSIAGGQSASSFWCCARSKFDFLDVKQDLGVDPHRLFAKCNDRILYPKQKTLSGKKLSKRLVEDLSRMFCLDVSNFKSVITASKSCDIATHNRKQQHRKFLTLQSTVVSLNLKFDAERSLLSANKALFQMFGLDLRNDSAQVVLDKAAKVIAALLFAIEVSQVMSEC